MSALDQVKEAQAANGYSNKTGDKVYTLDECAKLSKEEVKEQFDIATQIKIAKAIREGEELATSTAKKAASIRKAQRAARKAKPSAKATEVKERVKRVKKIVDPAPEKKSAQSSSSSSHCRVCGKPLSRETSVISGIGETCANKVGINAGMPAAEIETKVTKYQTKVEKRIASLTLDKLTDKYISLGKAWKAVKKTKVSQYAFIRATGGNGAAREPLNKHFQVYFYKGKRYLPASVLKHATDVKAAQR